jgi:hypothetical protein
MRNSRNNAGNCMIAIVRCIIDIISGRLSDIIGSIIVSMIFGGYLTIAGLLVLLSKSNSYCNPLWGLASFTTGLSWLVLFDSESEEPEETASTARCLSVLRALGNGSVIGGILLGVIVLVTGCPPPEKMQSMQSILLIWSISLFLSLFKSLMLLVAYLRAR